MSNDKITKVDLDDIALSGYTSYAQAVIHGRALPDVRDGLKPVQRRILYSMYHDHHLKPDGRFKKCASVVGSVLGKYHPHGDQAVYGALVRMAQQFNLYEPLIDGHGNFGSIDGDPPASLRYTESKLRPISMEMLSDLGNNVVDTIPNFDDSENEPVVLPARFPNVLVNGSLGIAVGVATSIPTHSLKECCDALVALIKNRDITTSDIVSNFIKAPDFPTGCEIISSESDLISMYEAGQGPVEMRATYFVEEKGNKKHLIFNSVPFGVNKSTILDDIGNIINNGALPQATNVRDESSYDIRIVVDLKKDADPNIVAAYLFSKTDLQCKFNVNMTCLVPVDDKGSLKPERIGLKKILITFLDFRFDCTKKLLQNELSDLSYKIHILEGFVKLSKMLHKAIETISRSKNRESAFDALKALLDTSDEQTKYILDTKISKLSEDDVLKACSELDSLKDYEKDIKDTLSSEVKIWKLIREEIKDISSRFGKPRQSSLIEVKEKIVAFDSSEFIADEDAVLIVTKLGFARRQKTATANVRLKDSDEVLFRGDVNSKQSVIFLTSTGRAYTVLGAEIAMTNGHGDHISAIFTLSDGEKLLGVFVPPKSIQEGTFIQAITGKGYISRFGISSILQPSTKRGKKFINLSDGDFIIRTDITNSQKTDIVLLSSNAKMLRSGMDDVPVKDSALKGFKAICLENDDELVFAGSFSLDGIKDIHVEIDGIKDKRLDAKTEVSPRGGKGKSLKKNGRILNIRIEN